MLTGREMASDEAGLTHGLFTLNSTKENATGSCQPNGLLLSSCGAFAIVALFNPPSPSDYAPIMETSGHRMVIM